MANLDDLPKHILLEIMKNLDYFGLKKCMRVSKNLNKLTQHISFNKKLFRSVHIIPKNGEVTLNKIRIHPAFDLMSFECASNVDDCYFLGDDFEDKLTDTSAAYEQATNPPVAHIRLQIHGMKMLQATNKQNGVTVIQVMKTLAKFFSDEKYRDAMGDHTGWTGFDETDKDSKGNLVLRSIWFDS